MAGMGSAEVDDVDAVPLTDVKGKAITTVPFAWQ